MNAYNVNERSQIKSLAGLNAYMRQVYLWMTVALGVSAIAALFTATNPAMLQAMYTSPFMIILFAVALIGLSVYITARIHTLSSGAATGFFLLYATGMGVFLGPTLTLYTASSVANAFLVTAGTFGGMSLYGMVTKRDLTGMGSFMMMGLWGILLAMIVNMFTIMASRMPQSPIIMKLPMPVRSRFVTMPYRLMPPKVPAVTRKALATEDAV